MGCGGRRQDRTITSLLFLVVSDLRQIDNVEKTNLALTGGWWGRGTSTRGPKNDPLSTPVTLINVRDFSTGDKSQETIREELQR